MIQPYFSDGTVTIYHGDCRDILPTIAADVLVTDPPYGVNIGKHGAASDHRARHLAKQGYASYDDTPSNFRLVIVPAITTALRITRRGLVFCAAHMAWDLPRPDAMGGVFLPSGCGRNAWGFASLAHCLLYGQAPALEKGCYPTAISSTATSEQNGHPMPKPLPWMTWAVSLASVAGETIIDPFMGSGTTLRAAMDLGRKAIGIEIEERYCEIAARRMGQQTLFGSEVA